MFGGYLLSWNAWPLLRFDSGSKAGNASLDILAITTRQTRSDYLTVMIFLIDTAGAMLELPA